WLVGIQPEEWIGSDRHVKAKLAVVDLRGRPMPGVRVRVDTRKHVVYSYRKRVVGGFYAYEHVDEIGPDLGTFCEGRADSRGLFICEGKAPAGGDLALIAVVRDVEG